MQRVLLAIDVGGSTSRAHLVAETGECLGYGRNRGGNPASNDREAAAAAIISAVETAVADAGGGPFDIPLALIGLAGPEVHVAMDRLEAGFRKVGLNGPIRIAGDLLAMFASASPATDGYCVLAGTGAGAARVRGGELDRVVDANGWLVGDLGSGYWLGHQATKAVTAHLDGRGAPTAMTPAMLAAYGIDWPDDRVRNGRPLALGKLTDAVYAGRAIDLARFAPLVMAHPDDPVAAGLIAEAERFMLANFATMFDPEMPGPVALGGGVVTHLKGLADAIGAIVREAGLTPNIRPVTDGSVGAAVLALRAAGQTIDQPLFDKIAASIATRTARAKG